MRTKTIGNYEVVWIGEDSANLAGNKFFRVDVRKVGEASLTRYWVGVGRVYTKGGNYDPVDKLCFPGEEDTDPKTEEKRRAVLEAVSEWEAEAAQLNRENPTD